MECLASARDLSARLPYNPLLHPLLRGAADRLLAAFGYAPPPQTPGVTVAQFLIYPTASGWQAVRRLRLDGPGSPRLEHAVAAVSAVHLREQRQRITPGTVPDRATCLRALAWAAMHGRPDAVLPLLAEQVTATARTAAPVAGIGADGYPRISVAGVDVTVHVTDTEVVVTIDTDTRFAPGWTLTPDDVRVAVHLNETLVHPEPATTAVAGTGSPVG